MSLPLPPQMEQVATIAGRLRMAMAARGMTVGRLAKRLGVPRAIVEGWLDGKTMSAEELVDVVTILRLRARWLVRGVGLMESASLEVESARETVEYLFTNLSPISLEVWIRCGIAMLEANESAADG